MATPVLDAALALHGAIVRALKADAPVAGLVAARIHDRPPAAVGFPWIEIGDIQSVSDDAECLDAFEVFATLHVWSRAVGRPEAATISGSVRKCLHAAPLALGPGWTLIEIRHQDTRHLKDPDGVSSHSVLTFRALIDPAF